MKIKYLTIALLWAVTGYPGLYARNLARENKETGAVAAGSRASVKDTTGKGSEPLDMSIGSDLAEYPQVKWLKGEPVTRFDKGKIYVVELWATWCVPCVAAMPHLEELTGVFKDKIIFIAQDVWEDDLAKVEGFVRQKGDALTCRVAAGAPRDSEFDTRWIAPAGVSGIPQTFIIQDGKLMWQTSPDKLNKAVLQLLVDGKFTVEAAEALMGKE